MKKYLAELLGTFALVFFGTGAIIVSDLYPDLLDHTGVAIVFGLTVMTVIYSIGDISGAHINPAVTLAFFIARRIDLRDTIFYNLFQYGGAVIASLLLKSFFPGHNTLGNTLPVLALIPALVLEIVISFYLMFVILHIAQGAKEKGLMAGVAVGGTVLLISLFAGPLTGSSMNPARTLGPALISWNLNYIWLYLPAAYLGMILAVFSCRLLRDCRC